MDIRGAVRGTGTIPANNVAPEKEVTAAPEFSKDGSASSPLDRFHGNAVIAEYMKYLEERGISEQDILDVLDALVVSGDVSYKFELFGKVPVEYHVRPSWVNDLILEEVDSEMSDSKSFSVVHYNNRIAVNNLAASITRYGDDTFSVKTKEDLINVRNHIQDMPYVIQSALVNKLAVFDRILAVATSDWAVENFTTPHEG